MSDAPESKPEVKLRKGQLEYAPIVEAIEMRGGIADALLAAEIEVDSTEDERITRMFNKGKTRGTAGVMHIDEICVRVLKKHPSELYGYAWFTA